MVALSQLETRLELTLKLNYYEFSIEKLCPTAKNKVVIGGKITTFIENNKNLSQSQ